MGDSKERHRQFSLIHQFIVKAPLATIGDTYLQERSLVELSDMRCSEMRLIMFTDKNGRQALKLEILHYCIDAEGPAVTRDICSATATVVARIIVEVMDTMGRP